MSSHEPQQSQVSRTASRRRQRSARLTVAVGLLLVAAVLVAWAVLSGSAGLAAGVSVVVLVLGAAATRITHSELMEARRENARDRAEQAQAYRVLTERRTAENAVFTADVRRRIAEREEAVAVLEEALAGAQKRAAEQTLKVGQEARRANAAEKSVADLGVRLEASDHRAAEAIVRVAELEADLDSVRAELGALKAQRVTRSA